MITIDDCRCIVLSNAFLFCCCNRFAKMTLVATMTKMGPKAVYGSLGLAGIFAGILSTIQSVNGE